MKKRICLFLALLTALTALSGCGKFTCEMCGEEKSGKKYTITLQDDKKITVCRDCHDEWEAMIEYFK